ncbi:MAG: hypothetical protein ACRCX2_05010, partial [Paraclostridium sp.]
FYVGDSSALRRIVAYKKSSPFVGDKPLDSISLCFYGDSTGIKEWNRSSDQMPIKTINMAGLQKWEETDDYIIYLDKDAVMTTVEQYVTGTYDLFKERKADIDGAMELLKMNNIEWTSEDDSKLILDINKAQLERIANTPTTMEEDAVPQTFTTRAVPTTYEACFRVGKKSGEIYIGEGYEYFIKDFSTGAYDISSSTFNFSTNTDYNIKITTTESVSTHQQCFTEVKVLDVDFYKFRTLGDIGSYAFKVRPGALNTIHYTKTSTPKPFVKSIMPSGKLSFVTRTTDATHTFLNKGDGVVTFENGYFSLKGDNIQQFLVYNALLTEQEKQAELAKDIKLR